MDDYAYDSLGRVVSAHQHGVDGGDAVADVEVDFTYNASNQIVSIDRYQSGQLAVEADYALQRRRRTDWLSFTTKGTTTLASYAWTYSDGDTRPSVNRQRAMTALGNPAAA